MHGLPFCLAAGCLAASLLTAQTSGGGYLLVANKGDRSLGIIDVSAGRMIANIPVNGVTGHEVIASPDGRHAFVPVFGNSGVGRPGTDGRTIAVVDIRQQRLVAEIDLGRGLRPHCPLFGPKDGLLYVTTEIANSVTVIDPATLKVLAEVPTGAAESHMLAIAPDNRRAYTANVGPGSVSVLDLRARRLITVIPVAETVQRISISPDGKHVFTSDQRSPRLAVIDTASNQVSGWIPLPATGYGTALTPDGRMLVVAMPRANQVAVVDLRTRAVVHRIDVPPTPQMALMRPDGKVVYVSCDRSGQIAAIRTSDWKLESLIPAGKEADGLAWAQ
ncbi:MAG: beta-propeller fold lactonase family protein [Bryobacteraceae bacterium]|jgi:YVTN family beta-propeller protein